MHLNSIKKCSALLILLLAITASGQEITIIPKPEKNR